MRSSQLEVLDFAKAHTCATYTLGVVLMDPGMVVAVVDVSHFLCGSPFNHREQWANIPLRSGTLLWSVWKKRTSHASKCLRCCSGVCGAVGTESKGVMDCPSKLCHPLSCALFVALSCAKCVIAMFSLRPALVCNRCDRTRSRSHTMGVPLSEDTLLWKSA